MRYLSENIDGSVALWACVPIALIRDEDGLELTVQGIRRKAGQCWIYGASGDDMFEVSVGDESFDVSDMADDHIKGYTVVWPDFEKDILAKLHVDTQAKHSRFRVLNRSEIPDMRNFRAAWRDGSNKVDTDMEHAREIQKDRLRFLRQPLLEQLDMEYMRADEIGDRTAKTRIALEKQQLRDVTLDPAISLATTPEELAAVIPAILNRG